MTKTEYKTYLCSDHWKETRKDHIEASDNKCERCSMPRWLAELVYDQDLHVHHKTYANLGNEGWEDLEVLCRRCHDVESFGRSELPLLKPQTCMLCHDKHWDKRSDFCVPCAWLTDGPNFYHLLNRQHPRLDKPMWKHFVSDLALNCFYEDEGVALMAFIHKCLADTRATMAKDINF